MIPAAVLSLASAAGVALTCREADDRARFVATSACAVGAAPSGVGRATAATAREAVANAIEAHARDARREAADWAELWVASRPMSARHKHCIESVAWWRDRDRALTALRREVEAAWPEAPVACDCSVCGGTHRVVNMAGHERACDYCACAPEVRS